MDHRTVGSGSRIRSVEAIPLRIPFGRAFTMAAPHQPTRNEVEVLLVQITTEDGVVGVGETQAWRRQGSGETLAGLTGKVREHVAPAMVGRPITQVAAMMADLSNRLAGSLYVRSAVGDALYDTLARSLDCPVYDLLGGLCRPEVAVGLAIGITGDSARMIDAAEAVHARGYRHIRVKIGIDADQDLACCVALRRHFGDKIVLRADANGGMNYGDALRLLSKLEACDLDIVEQPLPAWDLSGMAALARVVRIPLSADESLTDEHSLVAIANAGAASVMQTKSAKNGGVDGIRRLWDMARTYGIGIFPGNHPSTGVNVAAVAHLAAATPFELLVGDFQTGCVDMIAEDILTEPVVVRDGMLKVPEGPGFGVEIDPGKVSRYRVDAR